MMNQQVKDELQIERRLDKWAKGELSEDARTVVNDLASIYRAAVHVEEAINALTANGASAHDQGKALHDIETWLYQELESHAKRLKPKIGKVITQVYDHVADEE
jgi:hypothetical protein